MTKINLDLINKVCEHVKPEPPKEGEQREACEAMSYENQVAAVPMAFHVSEYIREELEARGWDADTLAVMMGFPSQRELQINRLALDFMLELQDPDMYLGRDLAEGLGRAFGVSPLLFARIDETWRRSMGKEPRDVDADFRPKDAQ